MAISPSGNSATTFNRLTVATRNVSDFTQLGVPTVKPFAAADRR